MNKSLHIFFYIPVLIIGIGIFSQKTYAIDEDSFSNQEEIFQTIFDDTQLYQDTNTIQKAPACQTTPESSFSVIEFLTSPDINAQKIVQNDIYLYTNVLNKRPFFTQPFFNQEAYCNKSRSNGLSLDIFYQETNHKNYTQYSKNLDSYIDLDHPDLLDDIDIKQLTSIDVPEFLQLFSPIAIQERKFGTILKAMASVHNVTLRAAMPFYYLERNFYLTQEQANNIQNKQIFLTTLQESAEKFLKQHLANDQLGLGDLTLSAEKILLETDTDSLKLQGRITIPTANSVKEGLIGGQHSLKCTNPDFSFLYIYQLGLSNDDTCHELLIDYITNFGIEVLDRLAANLAKTSLGQKHVSLGLDCNIHHYLNDYLFFSLEGYADYFMSNKEKRMLLKTINPSDFDRDYTSEQDADANLAFLNQRFIDMLYPPAMYVHVRPGWDSGARMAINLDTDLYLLRVGLDIWFATAEKLHGVSDTMYKIKQAERAGAYQSKIFADYSINKCWCGYQVTGTISGDVAIKQYGIGSDFTIAVQGAIEF